MAHRYAIYAMPTPGSALHDLAAAWLGRSPATGISYRRWDTLPDAEHAALVAAPRRYGFHATLKPPFKLAQGSSVEDLHRDLAHFAQTRSALPCPLTLDRIGDFLALTTPRQDSVESLAAACVTDFDRYRAPPSDDDLARRNKANLSQRQRQNLARWGYPYVIDDFRFHYSLTGRMPEERIAEISSVLAPLAEHPAARLHAIDAIWLFEEPAPAADFVASARFGLCGE